MVLAPTDASWSPDAARPLHVYAPRLLADWLGSTPERSHRMVEGTLVFADISGFTKLTERLARLGRVGAEEMSDALNATFTELLSEARADGADLVKWGGDAVLLLFDGPEHAARACRAAYRMRARLRAAGRLSTSAGAARLRMSVGVHSGTFHFFLVGDPGLHRELVVCGPDVSTLVGIEARAQAGQIAVGDSTAALLRPGLLGAAVDDVGHLLRREPAVAGAAAVVEPGGALHDVSEGLPVAIRKHLLQGAADPEHRHIAVAFVAFAGTDQLLRDEGPEATTAALDHCIRTVAAACAEHSVTFFETDVNRDGGKIMLTAGAPTSAGHDAERMLRTARAVVDGAGRLPLRVGVNLGNVFSGDFGPVFRRTYSVKGDAINVAARLVGRAEPGQVLATAAVPEQSQVRFVVRPLEPFTVKGKARPVHAVDVGPVNREATPRTLSAGALVGRDEQLRTLLAAVADVRARRGRYVDIVGEAGLGKTRLLDEVRRAARDLAVVTVVCDEFESSTPYHSFRLLLRDLLGIRARDDHDGVAARLEARVRDNLPSLVPWLPLLGVPLGLTLPDTEQTRTLSDEFRKRRVEEVVTEFLHVALPTQTVLLLDDAQHLDSASADLLHNLARHLESEPWLLVSARREREHHRGWVGPTLSVSRLTLTPLDHESSVRLLQAVTETNPLPRQTIAAIASRAGGNPMFLEALIGAADPAGTVGDLPHSVQDLVTTQVDRLAPTDRLVLRYASVLGLRFDPGELAVLVEGRAREPDPHTYERLDPFLVTDGDKGLRFRHSMMREVAYHGLAFRIRQQLHARVGERLESSDPDGSVELLSLHFLEARRFDKAWRYATVAAQRARQRYANQEAVDLFTRALEAERRGPRGLVPRSDLGGVLEELGDTWFAIGLPEQAADAYRRARRELVDDPVHVARVVAKEARIDQRLRKLPQSLRRVSRALHLLEQEPGRWASSARSLLAMRYAISRLAQGRVDEALRWGHRAATDAEESVDKPTLAQAYATLHGLYVAAVREPPMPFGELALQAYTELGDLPHQADCTNNLAVSALDHNLWPQAVESFGKAAAIYRRIGDTQGEGLASYNQAEVLVRQGHLERAQALLAETLVTARAVSDNELVALVRRELGRIHARQGRTAEAVESCDRAVEIFEKIDELDEVPATVLAAAEALVLGGDGEACLDRVGTLPEVDETLAAQRERVVGFALLTLDRLEEADGAFQRGLAAARDQDDRFEEALCLVGSESVRADADGGIPRRRFLTEVGAVLDALGVVALPVPAFLVPAPVGDYGKRTFASSTKSR